jgi:hypothetical protein
MFGHGPVIAPLLAAAEPDLVIEIGVYRGAITKLALRTTADRSAAVHAIDPAPQDDFDLAGLQREFGERFVFHRGLSLEVLPEIRGADAVLIDGDHNWYTVYNELKTIARVAAEEGKPFPLTLMHDVEFPYADRDMYYFPDTIPEEYRQPTGRGGMVMGEAALVTGGGLGAGSHNALTAGGPHNGVKTAIDDFLAEVEAPVSFTSVIGFFGLGVLYDERQLEQHPQLRERIAELDSPEWLKEQCRRIEHGRLLALTQLQAASRRETAARRAAREADPA